ncbi:MAG: WD40/YVTN/BNR-like repeat-containing protein [Gaiellaceae bacterium]
MWLTRTRLLIGAGLLFGALACAVGVGAARPPLSATARDTGVFEPAAVSFISPTKGWVLGRAGCSDCATLRVTTDGGRHWAALPSPPVPLWYYDAKSRAVRDVTFADPANGFLFAPGLLTTHDGGRSWRRQSLPPVQQLSVAAGHAFALTRAGTGGRAALWRTPIGKDRWTRLPLPGSAASPSSTSAFSLELAAQGAVVALLQPGSNGPSPARTMLGRIWSSNDLGESWRARAVPCTTADGGAALLAIARNHPHTWLIDCFDNEQSSQEQNTQHRLYRSLDAGATWTRVSDPTRHNMPALLTTNGAGHAFLATEGGAGDTLVGSLDGGRHWQLLLRSGGNFFGWADLAFVAAKVGFVVGPTHYAPEHLYRTDNGGRSWRILRLP